MDANKKMELAVWHTKDGSAIKVVEMSTKHIGNTIRHLRRRINEVSSNAALRMEHGDEEVVAAIQRFTDWIEVFEKELARRAEAETLPAIFQISDCI